MGVGSAVKGLLGIVEKATIEVIDATSREVTTVKSVDAGGTGSGLSLSMPDVSALTDAVSTVTTLAAGVTSTVQTHVLPKNAKRRKFEVQFNPNEISFSGFGGASVSKMTYSDNDDAPNAVAQAVADTRITMSVNLIFDDVTAWDSFMADRLNTSPTALITNGIEMAKSLMGKSHSVQQQVEGFIAALRTPGTCHVIFTWGDMGYSGVLSRVGAHYTMFNSKGYPVRAVVNMTMVCVDQSIKVGNMGQWEKHYENAFEDGSFSLVGAAQKVGNLLNINL